MTHRWSLRCPPPENLVFPVPMDPGGVRGPTRGQAYGPRWRRTSKGLFVPASADRDVVEQRIVEAWAGLPAGSVVSGWAALRLYGGNFFDGRDDSLRELPVPAVIPPGANTHLAGVERHREAVPRGETSVRYGVACTTPARALFDAIKWAADERAGVTAGDMATSARLVGLEEMRRYVDSRRGDRSWFPVWEAMLLVIARSKSPKETWLRLIWILDAGLPRPKCNWPVADAGGRRIGRPDLLSEECAVVGEYDGADHREEESRQRADFDKEDAYRDTGLESFRVVGRDLYDVPKVVARMRSAVRRAAQADRPRRWLVARDPGPL